ncbi:hypothetical protein [Pedosphaera parvula]|uniref:Uncharacterized protein n=1 Tax=Pedosphaera parvula (strain Ellin514) TaxID=320771 RepID=B9XCY1_PEDPL|nr:hypothetical protein [Pedosphaera parvula]EEF62327.1 hypothetical protein Cflav_PD4962 [Pedosphaera parvula Ellin514]
MNMNLQSAFDVIERHSTGTTEDSFTNFLMESEVSGMASGEKLQAINEEILDALQSINLECRKSGLGVIGIKQMQSATIILTEGWDRYRWWVTNSYFSADFLQQFSQTLSDWGFAWARILDGSTPDLRRALADRRENNL